MRYPFFDILRVTLLATFLQKRIIGLEENGALPPVLMLLLMLRWHRDTIPTRVHDGRRCRFTILVPPPISLAEHSVRDFSEIVAPSGPKNRKSELKKVLAGRHLSEKDMESL